MRWPCRVVTSAPGRTSKRYPRCAAISRARRPPRTSSWSVIAITSRSVSSCTYWSVRSTVARPSETRVWMWRSALPMGRLGSAGVAAPVVFEHEPLAGIGAKRALEKPDVLLYRFADGGVFILFAVDAERFRHRHGEVVVADTGAKDGNDQRISAASQFPRAARHLHLASQ